MRIPAGSSRTREARAQTIARAPVSLGKLLVEDHAATVVYRTAYNPYFRTNRMIFRASDFIAELLQHLPDPRLRLIRRCGSPMRILAVINEPQKVRKDPRNLRLLQLEVVLHLIKTGRPPPGLDPASLN